MPVPRDEGHSVVRVKIDTIRTLQTMMALSPDRWSESTGDPRLRDSPDRMKALEAVTRSNC